MIIGKIPPKTGPILVVDDDDDVRDSVAGLLRREHHQVTTAADGQEALAHLVGGCRPRLILLDLMMPNMDGFVFVMEVRKLGLAHIPVVVFTAAGDASSEARKINAAGWLQKPFTPEELLDTITAF